MLNSTKRFSSRVENYVRYRPGYPEEIIRLLREECSLKAESVIVDVGSGTGKLSELFLKNGNPVFGVEPNKEMREAGGRLLKHFESFTSVEGAAEATTLEGRSADFITAGQAFHWFDHRQTRIEFLRVLKSGGWVVIVWNDRRSEATPFLTQYENLLLEFATDYEQVNHRRVDDATTILKFFNTQPRLKTFPSAQCFDFDGLKGRLLSSSYAPETGAPKHDEMLSALKRIFETHQQNGQVVFEYDTKVYYGHLT
jgi:ubiquinone/menaquinone biosynthesis C-methylase UbiE